MTQLETLATYSFGAVLAGSAAMAILLHYYSLKAKAHFAHAETRLKHAKKLIGEAGAALRSMKKKVHSKASGEHVEAKISKAIADLLSALEEEERVVARRR